MALTRGRFYSEYWGGGQPPSKSGKGEKEQEEGKRKGEGALLATLGRSEAKRKQDEARKVGEGGRVRGLGTTPLHSTLRKQK